MPATDYTPDLDAIGALMRARTKASEAGGGQELGTFTDDTRPTEDEATILRGLAVGTVTARLGADIHERLFDLAKHVVALRTAMLIELAYFPEQISEGRSPYEQYKALYDEAWRTLVDESGQEGAAESTVWSVPLVSPLAGACPDPDALP